MMSFLSSTAWPRLLLKEPFDGSEAEAEKYIFGTMHFERRPWDYYYTCVFSAAVMHFKVKDTVMPSINNQKCSWAMPCIIFAWLLPRRHYFIYMRNRPCKHIFSQVLHFCISSSNADFFSHSYKKEVFSTLLESIRLTAKMYLIVSQHLKVFNTADLETLKMYLNVSNTFQFCEKSMLT